MPIKNYTSSVDCFTSLGEIQGALARGGASKIMIGYQDGKPTGVLFALPTALGERSFALPANVDGVMASLQRAKVKADREQAERTAWKNIRDWVLAQMAFVEAGQVRVDEVFFPYLSDGKQTLYQAYQNGQLALPGGIEK